MSTIDSISMQTIKPIPHWMVLTLCWLFAILYGVWILPETVFIRHFCLVVGALLSLYVIYPNSRLLLKKEAAPIWLIGLLILWVTFHLFFIGKDFNAQWEEYTRIWKKIAVGSVFAIGLGIALISQSSNQKHTNQYWRIVYLGFLLPGITYFVKLGATTLGKKYGFEVPVYLIYEPNHMAFKFGISRAWYVYFCLPSVAISIGALAIQIKYKSFLFAKSMPYIACIPMTLLIFYIENDRLGMFFGFVLVVIAIFYLGLPIFRNQSAIVGALFLLAVSTSAYLLINSFQKNPIWHSLIADAKVAIKEVDRNDAWRNPWSSSVEWPINELGQKVNNSNYLRISWFIVGSSYISKKPLGYGLLSLSFGALDRENRADSAMSWSHSAWLDFTLGYGIPGLLLMLMATLMACWNGGRINPPWILIGGWGLPTLSMVLIVKEISSEIFINSFIFMIVFSAALSLGSRWDSSSNTSPHSF